ncbi:hypothetical protein DCS_05435 [Drechmeria coniospora]|uniref:DUF3984 domain protein n=1 Tax=Drechmeria coniospora TaxID=98403 RepID=A0A151GMV3_DRECN|nr:hypothetical protein DCS_05435 [Drechmeria coniospora]KYK58420.1 hypothetical protein DCS_05435 [Drechmeria coniospora]ODA83784.1 hypothetical protein RJ55_02300 [Drechmeria coniospora]
MDVAYSPRALRERRKSRSSTNINHLSLAPLTVKLPLDDADNLPDGHTHQTMSYLQGKSAPTTPRLLSRSTTPSRSRSHQRNPSAPSGAVSKSKSSTHLAARKPMSGSVTPRRRRDDRSVPAAVDDSDWILRTGALMSSEAREYKGQTWLVSRQSSTSLAGMRDVDEVVFEQELARERELHSRRGSSALADDDATPNGSRFPSRFQSRSHSLVDGRSRAATPLDHASAEGSYFPAACAAPGPDFVNLDEKLEQLEEDEARDTTLEDEVAVRRLVRRGQPGKSGSWISNAISWSLFSVDESEEESDDDEADDDADDSPTEDELSPTGRRGRSGRHFEGVSNAPLERLPPPATDEGGWKDAAWLLSVATKIVF